MKKGQKVRVIDNGKLSLSQRSQLGKKGKIKTVQAGKGAYVVFKSGSALWFASDQMQLVANRNPFDLERALKGEEVVTRDGLPVTGFSNNPAERSYPITAVVDDFTEYFTIRGKYQVAKVKSPLDLFMKHPTKVEKEPVVMSTRSALFPDVNLAFEDKPAKSVIVFPEYEKLKETFINMLECYTIALKAKGSDKDEVKKVWMGEAGL